MAVGRVSGNISLMDGHTGQPCGDIAAASASDSEVEDRLDPKCKL